MRQVLTYCSTQIILSTGIPGAVKHLKRPEGKISRFFSALATALVTGAMLWLMKVLRTRQRLIYLINILFQNKGDAIPAEKLPALFDKFYRLDEARISDTGGTGLGLAIAKEIILLHGGRIQASSENDTVTFTVELPAAD